jgi:hypothetical protein
LCELLELGFLAIKILLRVRILDLRIFDHGFLGKPEENEIARTEISFRSCLPISLFDANYGKWVPDPFKPEIPPTKQLS